MFRKLLGAVTVLALCIGLALADEHKGKVTKVDGNKITVDSKKDGVKDFDISGAKVSKKKGKEKEAADASAIKQGAGVTVIYEGGKVTEVIVGGGKKQQ